MPGMTFIRQKISKISHINWLKIILTAGVLLRIVPSLIMGDTVIALPGIFDQITYHTLANRLLGGYGFTFPTIWWPITKAGAPTAHWSYLYTFYLTGIYTLFGVHPLFARLLQAILAGLLTPWLIYRISKRTFSYLGQNPCTQLSLLAAGWTAIYPYFMYYSAALMTETFFIIGVLWIVDASQRLLEKERIDRSNTWISIEFGFAIGITALLRQLVLLFVPILLLYFFWVYSRHKKIAAGFKSAAQVGFISIVTAGLLIAPFTILNYRHFKRFVLLNTNAGYAFFWANHPIYGDHFVPILTDDMPSYQQLIPAELRNLDEAALDQALLKRGIGFVLSDPIRYIKLSISRIPAYFMFWPSKESGLLSNLSRVFSFGLALPFMVLGTVLWMQDVFKKKLDPAPGALLLLFSVTYSAIHILSWALIRYRLPVDAVMLIFAARGLIQFIPKVVPNGQ